MKNCDEMVNSLFERREQYITEQKRKRKVITRTAASVCCICFVAVLSYGIWEGGWMSKIMSVPPKASPAIGIYDSIDNADDTNQPSDSIVSNETQTQDTNSISKEESGQDSLVEWKGKIISDYIESSAASYQIPDSNSFGISIPLKTAIKEYGDTARYAVVVDIFVDNDVCTDLSILEAEMLRVKELGYETYIEVNNSKEEPIYYFCMQATKEQLENFDCNENYGYFFFGRSERIE